MCIRDRLSCELYKLVLGEEIVHLVTPAEWPDSTASIREMLGEPNNISGPGNLLSDEWVPPVVELEPEPEPLPVPPQIVAIHEAKAEAITNRVQIEDIERNQNLNKQAQPLRAKLLETVMPTITEGMIKVCEEQPKDPVDFLQRFLLECEAKQNVEVTKSLSLPDLLALLQEPTPETSLLES
eukprot:TRINITY_DN59997_c0_g1_i4.p1 TRINITY_DN59997_c0_g1~~TRINITY_DN59997_c0_g1_i4.p1  ORF type:complete len:182 (+),score=61.36 TRINITY_DN59997_c0_g1_i4:89-634(+)